MLSPIHESHSPAGGAAQQSPEPPAVILNTADSAAMERLDDANLIIEIEKLENQAINELGPLRSPQDGNPPALSRVTSFSVASQSETPVTPVKMSRESSRFTDESSTPCRIAPILRFGHGRGREAETRF